MADGFDKPGQALQAALAARGAALSVEESARLADLLLMLAERGLLVAATHPAVHGPRPLDGPGAVGGYGGTGQDPAVSNTGSSIHRDCSDAT